MVKLNEEIIGGIVSALSRGESLEKAMMTFYNAGYEKEEIEDSAKEVYDKVGAKAMGVTGSLQDTLDDISVKAGIPKKEKPKEEKEEPAQKPRSILDDEIIIEPIVAKAAVKEEKPDNQKENVNQPQRSILDDEITLPEKSKKEQKEQPTEKDKEKKKTDSEINIVSAPSHEVTRLQYIDDEEITNKIKQAIKDLKPAKIPSKIEIVHKSDPSNPQTKQYISEYSEPKKEPGKFATYLLLTILIILLGALIGVFIFKEDLIKLFNNLGLT